MTKKPSPDSDASDESKPAAPAEGKVKAMLRAAKEKKKHRGSGGSKGPRDRGDDDAATDERDLHEKAASEATKGLREGGRAGARQKTINAHKAAAGRRSQGRRDSKGR